MKTSSLFILSLCFLFISLPSPCLCATKEKCNPQDKKVLLEIKEALNNPYHLASWNPQTDCCSWYPEPGPCDINPPYRVIELIINKGNISGQIPDAVGDLPYLQKLWFRKLTNLTGQIPRAITKLTHLKELRLSETNLSGPVPAFLSELKNLTYLDLSSNNLSGSIPPELSQLENLSSIHLDRNKLTGRIPESFGKFKGTISDLDLSHNQLSGPVPRSLGDLNFTQLDFSRNKLEGDVSFLFGKNKTLLTIDLSRNSFQFNLSKVEFNDNLQHLDLNHNRKIYGSLPEGMAQLSNLRFLNVSYNNLSGQIPIGGNLQSFDSTAYFHNKGLCGAPLPACK